MGIKISICILLLLVCTPISKGYAQQDNIAIGVDYKRIINTFAADTSQANSYLRRGSDIRRAYIDSPIIAIKRDLQDSALWYYNTAINISRQIGFENGIAIGLINIGGYYSDIGDYKRCILYYQQTEQHMSNWVGDLKKHDEILNTLYHNMASTYFSSGEYVLAAKYFSMLLNSPTLKSEREHHYQAVAYEGLASVWNRMRKPEMAMRYYDMAENLARAYKDTATIISVQVNKSGLDIDLNKLDDVLLHSGQALALYEAVRHSPNYISDKWLMKGLNGSAATCYANMATALIQLDSPTQAMYYAQKSLNMGTDGPDAYIPANYILGYIYYMQKEYKKAQEYVLPAIEKALESGMIENLSNGYAIMASSYYELGDYKTAYHYKDAYVAIKDSIQNERNNKILNNLEVQNRVIAKDKELLQNRLELATRTNQLKEKNMLIGGICISALLIGTFGFYRYRNKQRLQEKRISMIQQEQEIRQLKAMMEGEEKERMRIARDLHDGVSQTISAAKVNMMAIEEELGLINDNKKEKFDKIIHLIDSSFKEVRTISHNMMPYALREAGLAVLIKQLIDNITTDKLTINLHCHGLDEHFDSNIETVVYRVIQECINNVLKHAHATRLDISLTKDEDGLSITIEDNGVGFDIKDVTIMNGIGVNNIKARIHYLHGQVEYDSSIGNGTLVSIQVPIPNNNG